MYNILEVLKYVTDPVTGVTKMRADLAGSTSSDLPSEDNEKFLTDSTFYARQEGKMYVKDDDENWYDTDGNEA